MKVIEDSVAHSLCFSVLIVEVKTNFENDHSKLRIAVYSRLENQIIWPLVVTVPAVGGRRPHILKRISVSLYTLKHPRFGRDLFDASDEHGQ